MLRPVEADRWARYVTETDALAAFVAERVNEHEVLANAARRPTFERFLTGATLGRWTVLDWRDALDHHAAAAHPTQRLAWQWLARERARTLRRTAREWKQHPGYRPEWRRAPR